MPAIPDFTAATFAPRRWPPKDMTGWITYGTSPASRSVLQPDLAVDRLGAVDASRDEAAAPTEAPVDAASGVDGSVAAGGHAPLMPASGPPRLP